MSHVGLRERGALCVRDASDEHHERRRAVQLANEAEVGEGSLEAEEGDDGDRVAAPPLLDQPDPHLVRDVRSQLLVLRPGELVEEGELPRAEEDLGDAQLVVVLV